MKEKETNFNEDDSGVLDNGESQSKKLKYPRAIPFILGNEFCERFNYYGMRTILVLYLNRELNYSTNDSTVIFHVFTMMVYFLCTFGAIIADSWLGKFRTILYLSIVYVFGSVIVSLGAIADLNLPPIEMTLIGLVLVALGSGGIKPCVAAFGGDQFKMPEQTKQMAQFFSLFYFCVNSGSVISTTITPILREDVHCFGEESCFSLAFGVPAVLMCISIVIFLLGRPLYLNKPPAGNMVMLVAKTIGNAVYTKIRESKHYVKDHWLDYAEKKYDKTLIGEVKVLLRVLLLYVPLPLFWALFDQQASRWTFQATRMDGVTGAITIKPDQMILMNSLLILVFIPLCETVVYPLMSKIGIRRPLQKLFCGGVLAGVAFTISGIIQLELEKTYPVFPSENQSEMMIFNGYPGCDYTFTTDIPNHNQFKIKGIDYYRTEFIDVSKKTEFSWQFTSNSAGCPSDNNGKLKLEKGETVSFFLTNINGHSELMEYIDSIEKPEKGSPEIRILANLYKSGQIKIKDSDSNNLVYNLPHTNNSLIEIPSSTYNIYINDNKIMSNVEIKLGGVYTIIIGENVQGNYITQLITITIPNSLHILWQIPQYVIMTLGEVMFSVTGLEFSYSQAPASMKSVLQACWLLTIAVGNVIVVIIAELKIFNEQSSEFFLFAGLMFIDMLFFSWLAYRYKSNNPNIINNDDQSDQIDQNDQNDKIDKIDKSFNE